MVLQVFHDGLGAGVDVELVVDVSEVASHRFHADSQGIRNFFVKMALANYSSTSRSRSLRASISCLAGPK